MSNTNEYTAMSKKELIAHYKISWKTWCNWIEAAPDHIKALIKPGKQIFTPNEVAQLRGHWG